ncbi:MAG: hypothetical protein WCX73_03310 [Candidatus Pacearchaeota archaeon]|jgi:hypothetical protein
MNLKRHIINNTGQQLGDEYHDSFVRFLSNKDTLNLLGIKPPYRAIGLEVKTSDSGRRKSDLIVLNHELSIIEAKVIRSLNPDRESVRIKQMNNQLTSAYSFFKRKNINTQISLIGAYKKINETSFSFYYLPPSGLSIDCLEIFKRSM